MIVFLSFFILSVGSGLVAAQQDQDECQPTKCHPSGPVIRFPFRLEGHQPPRCGYPGFDLSCNNNDGSTEFKFQFPVSNQRRNIILPVFAKAAVKRIDYANQLIGINNVIATNSCLPSRIPQVNASASPFELYDQDSDWYSGYSLFNCSRESDPFSPYPRPNRRISCLDQGAFRVYAVYSLFSGLNNCVKMYDISYIPPTMLNWSVISYTPETMFSDWPYVRYYSGDTVTLKWSEPVCGSSCEASGMFCRLKINGTNNQTECFRVPKKDHVVRNAVVVFGVSVMAAVVAVAYQVNREKKRQHQKQTSLQQFLEDYGAMRPTRFSYAEVKNITDGFKHKLGQGGYGTVFKGGLPSDIVVAVKVLNNVKGNGDEFINEVGTIGKIHHVNVVRLVGYCADGYRRALVYEFLENDSLDKYISSGNQRVTLGWEKLHKISIDIAKGIDYLHQGCNQRILHFDIKPHNVLLDRNFNPKVADFGLAKLCSKEQSAVTMTAIRGTIGYIAPEVFSRNFGTVSYKADIYSFGMLLLNMVDGRKTLSTCEQEMSEVYFPEWMYNQLDNRDDIAIQIEEEDEINVVKRLIIVGLWCIQWYPADRPSMKEVIQMLEGESMPIIPPNPFAASESMGTNATSSGTVFYSAQMTTL